MVAKFVLLAAFVAVASTTPISDHTANSHASITQHHTELHHGYVAPGLHYATPAVHVAPTAHYAVPIQKHVVEEDHHAPAHYDFEYSVHDPHTGDEKEQKENRQGDVVHGSYSFIEADGSKRTVEYTVDKYSGFNAVVHREHSQHPVAHKAVAVHAAPDHSYYHH